MESRLARVLLVASLGLVAAPWTGIFPGLAIAVTVLAVNLLGDALSGATDPRQS